MAKRRTPPTSSATGAACGDTLRYQQNGREETLSIGAAAWYAWLEQASAFSFTCDQGSFTAHKTRAGNGRGGWYWRAYRRRHGRLGSVYLGASGNLTLGRLQTAAR